MIWVTIMDQFGFEIAKYYTSKVETISIINKYHDQVKSTFTSYFIFEVLVSRSILFVWIPTIYVYIYISFDYCYYIVFITIILYMTYNINIINVKCGCDYYVY